MITLVSHSICSITGKAERTVNESREVTIPLYEREMKTGNKKCPEEPRKTPKGRRSLNRLFGWLTVAKRMQKRLSKQLR